MKQPIFQVDAFTDELFGGNPAAVCPLKSWLPDVLMQKIAMENNLSETAFFVREGDHYRIRWFTPTIEVDLCGHATLASAFVIFNLLDHKESTISFESKSGSLKVSKEGDMLTLNFPADTVEPAETTKEICKSFDKIPLKTFRGKDDYLLLYSSEEEVKSLIPNFKELAKIEARGVIVTAAGDEVDFVSRFFAPQSGVAEDPVTGSAHTTLTPYWAQKLDKTSFTARQLSARGGALECRMEDDRVAISGKATLFMTGELNLPD